nr:hypothetical protein [Tanacetum cinerariifolium]
MGDEHLDTIPATKSDEFIKSSVETLIPIPSESEEFSSTGDDSFSFDKIDYVESSPPDSELISSKVMETVIPKVGGIEASNDNPIPFYDLIISTTPPNLTPLGESDFFLEVDAFLAVEDEPTSSQFPKSYLGPEGDMLLLEAFLNDDHSSNCKTKYLSLQLSRRGLLPNISIEMCMCLKDHLDAKERKQDKCPLEIRLDFEEYVFDDEVQRNEAIPLSDEEIALDASSEGTLSPGGPR